MLSATKTPPATWSEQAVQRLRELVDRPVVLVLVLLAANAVTRPYANIAHDTRLYSVQVLNQAEHGAYSNDLYFRYGSQDQYSFFSILMAPLVRLMGLETAFFLVYLAGNTLFITALVGLVRRLVDDRLLALVSLVYLVIAPLNYGGLCTLHVHEAFLTPRLLAVGLVLFGLDQLLQARLLASFLLMVAAGLLHPLMAVGGLLIWSGVFLIDKLGWRWALTALAAIVVGGATFLAIPSVAGRVLGEMDDDWRGAILHASAFNFTAEWEIRDWGNIFFCGVGVVGGVFLFWTRDRSRAWFVATAGIVGVAAVLGTVAAEHLPYALPLQGQPYRALWILKVLQVPLCFLLADHFLRSERLDWRVLALVPLGFLLQTGPASLWDLEWRLPLFFLPGTIVAIRGLEHQPRRPDWLIRSLAMSFVLGEVVWCAYRQIIFVSGWSVLRDFQDSFDLLQSMLVNIGIVPSMLLVLASTAWLMCHGLSRRSIGLACLVLFLAVQTTFFAAPNTALVRENGCYLPDIMFARDYLQDHRTAGKMPTVYSSYGKVEYVWLELKTNSYFDWWQTGGFMFRRQTAMEGQRRALVVAPFEVERFRRLEAFLDDRVRSNVRSFFHIGIDAPLPTVADLAVLCQEPDLDYAILSDRFPGLYSATNGRVYIYDCEKVRAALKIPTPVGQAFRPAVSIPTAMAGWKVCPTVSVSPTRKTPHDPS